MYRVLKEKGNNQTITLENKDTKASIMIGKLTMPIVGLLEREIDFDESRDDTVKLKDKWDLEISDELGKELAKTAMPMKKPIRKKTTSYVDSPSEQTIHKKKTKSGKDVVDVFDLIFGTE